MMNIIVAYRGIPQARGYAFGACLARAFRRLGHHVFEYGNYYQTPEPLSETNIPTHADAVIYCECNDLDKQYWELQSIDAPIKAYWDFDVDTHPGKTFHFVRKMRFTHLFYANKFYGERFQYLCPYTAYLPIGFDDELFLPMRNVVQSVDVGLCGTPYPSRIALIEALNQAGIDAHLVTGVFGDEYVQTINKFKIHLNHEVGGGKGLIPARVWETLGCNRLLLTEDANFSHLFFQDMKEVVFYSTQEECIEKIRNLLKQRSLIDEISERGYLFAMSNHTYLNRAMAMMTMFEASTNPIHAFSTSPSVQIKLQVQLLLLQSSLKSVKSKIL